MDKENGVNVRVTRARAKALKESSRNEQAVVVGLRDVTNISAKSHHKRTHTSNFEVYTYINVTMIFILLLLLWLLLLLLLLLRLVCSCVFFKLLKLSMN